MMPVPARVSELYPPPPGVVRERPWWRFHGQDATRADGATIYDAKVTELEEYDRLHPIPHPGFRAGQMWASAWGTEISIVVITRDVIGTTRSLGESSRGGMLFPADKLRAPSGVAILLADPCCPWLAPWSPVVP